jgi:hypothetical protein
MLRFLGYIADKLINAFAPVVAQRSFEAMDSTNWLADVEADHDSWEPDELWAAQHKLTDAATPLACVSVTPAAALDGISNAGGGGHLHPDVERLLANIDRMFQKLNP